MNSIYLHMHMNIPVYSSMWRMRDLKASQRACVLCKACNNAKEKNIYIYIYLYIYIQGQAPVNVNKTESLHRLTEPHTDNSHYMLFTCLCHIQYNTGCPHITISCKSNSEQYLFALLSLYILIHIFLFFCPCLLRSCLSK